jgi:hypothetical protein
MSALPAVLSRLDADREGAIQRLFEWVRSPSISTDSAWKADCARAGDWLVADLTALGFESGNHLIHFLRGADAYLLLRPLDDFGLES